MTDPGRDPESPRGFDGLAREHCQVCRPGTPPLSHFEVEELADAIAPAWRVNDERLQREFSFRDFNGAFGLATRIALLAEAEGHHPDLEIGWGRLVVSLTTHAIGGLSRNDFVLAAKIDRLANPA
jgi:4a-hydroxytetrahydrobiopterin dehydratase